MSVLCFADNSEDESIIVGRDACICKVAIHPVALILCLLFAIASPQDFNFIVVGLELCDVKHLLSFAYDSIMARIRSKVKG
jgi:hypothetical protein